MPPPYPLYPTHLARYEAQDESRLALFLVERAATSPAFAIMLHWWVVGGCMGAGVGGRVAC